MDRLCKASVGKSIGLGGTAPADATSQQTQSPAVTAVSVRALHSSTTALWLFGHNYSYVSIDPCGIFSMCCHQEHLCHLYGLMVRSLQSRFPTLKSGQCRDD